LPDGLFSNLGKFWNAYIKWGYILLPFGIFYRHLEYFMTIRYILCSFGTFWCHLPRIIWQPWYQRGRIKIGNE
jgi:hypothetical protein